MEDVDTTSASVPVVKYEVKTYMLDDFKKII